MQEKGDQDPADDTPEYLYHVTLRIVHPAETLEVISKELDRSPTGQNGTWSPILGTGPAGQTDFDASAGASYFRLIGTDAAGNTATSAPAYWTALTAVQERYLAESDELNLAAWRQRPASQKVLQNIARLADSLL